mmetsp:Transcript_97406/g.208992  ORF Transcript_97406/g.208992 Transcript_97406/m.208992 type:complete len:267 (-) Transcript_97406:1299-2099(-)
MRERKPMLIFVKTLVSFGKSRRSRRLISLARCRSCRETRHVRPRPMPAVSASMMIRTARPVACPSCTRSCDETLIPSMFCCTVSAVSVARAIKAPTGNAATTSHLVSSSRLTERVPTCQQSPSVWSPTETGSHSCSSGCSLSMPLGLKVKSCCPSCNCFASQAPKRRSSARAVTCTTVCGESSAIVAVSRLKAWAAWEAPKRRPRCDWKRFETWATMKTAELAESIANGGDTREPNNVCRSFHCKEQSRLMCLSVMSAAMAPSKQE